jgi:hypothetical protein
MAADKSYASVSEKHEEHPLLESLLGDLFETVSSAQEPDGEGALD